MINELSGKNGECRGGASGKLFEMEAFISRLREFAPVENEFLRNRRDYSFCLGEVVSLEVARVTDAVFPVALFPVPVFEEMGHEHYRRLDLVRRAVLDSVGQLVLSERGRDVAQDGIRDEARREDEDKSDRDRASE